MEDYQQIVKFLKALDGKLQKPIDIFIIGGSTITLTSDQRNRTEDIDAVEVEQIVVDLGGKNSLLAKQFGVYIHKVYEIDFTAPKDWRNQAKLLDDLDLVNLKIYAADIHDIILGKLARLEPKDFKDISSLFNENKIDVNYLLKRLNENAKQLQFIEYRNNAKLAFEEIFNKKLIFRQGRAKLA